MAAFDAFWYMDARNFQEVNGALMVLLPKTLNAVAIKDYIPISLIDVIGKLFSKVLANCLAARLGEMVHGSQSAFIKGRLIQDNYRFGQAVAKLLHSKKKPLLLLKVHIATPFNSVSWSFHFEVLSHFGFLSCWVDWLFVLLSMANTKVMLNGSPGSRICHGRGLHQGDPLSPMLFLLIMKVLNAIFCKADEWALLQ
jgi:hypothetical protein